MTSKNDENTMDYIAFHLCRGLAEWDANEVLPDSPDRKSRGSENRHSNDNEG